MDPRVFDHEFGRSLTALFSLRTHNKRYLLTDADIMVEMYKYCRKVAATAPFKDIIGKLLSSPKLRPNNYNDMNYSPGGQSGAGCRDG